MRRSEVTGLRIPTELDALTREAATAHARALMQRYYDRTTASTPTTGEGMDKPLAVTGSGRTANTGGLDSPGVGTSTTQGERA